MDSRIKSRIAAGAAGLAVVAGGGIAYAATATGTTTTTRSDGRDAVLNDVATRLKVSRADLDAALKGARDDQLDQAVKDGKLTQAQADAIKARTGKGAPGLGGGPGFGGHGAPMAPGPGGRVPGGPGGPGAGGHVGGGAGGELGAAATYLGLSTTELAKQLQAGKSLADVAKAQSKDVDGLKAALVAAATKDLEARIGDLVDGKRPAAPSGTQRRRFRGGPRGFGGPPIP